MIVAKSLRVKRRRRAGAEVEAEVLQQRKGESQSTRKEAGIDCIKHY